MRQLTLREYQTELAVELSRVQRDVLNEVVPSLSIVPRPDQPGSYDLTPSSWIGSFRIDDLAVEIRPKIPIDRLLFLISYSLHGTRWQQFPFQADPDVDVVEAIAYGFIAQIRRAMRWGLLHGYRTHYESLTMVRGRIRFSDHIRDHFGQAPPIAVSFDEFTEDIVENQLLKAAADQLIRMRLHSSELLQELRAIGKLFSGVKPTVFESNRLPRVTYTRLNEHYRPAVEMAKLILQAASYELRHGATHATAFLFDMNQVFEDFVVVALRDALKLPASAFPQEASGRLLVLDQNARIKLKPDLSWWEGAKCTFVGDVKYKRTLSGDGNNSDLYQLLAYMIATNLPTGMLIHSAGEMRPSPHQVRYLGRTLDVRTLDLSGSPSQILEQIESIAQQIRMTREVIIPTTESSRQPHGSDTTLGNRLVQRTNSFD